MLINSNGYLKLCDFGFAKYRNYGTSTLCGTPQYMAPEMLQGLNQSFGVDWWALGILIFVMIYGMTPFNDGVDIKMYHKVLTMSVDFPTRSKQNDCSKSCKTIINLLLMKSQHLRLGSGPFGISDVKSNEWFQSIDWNLMISQRMTAPYIPNVKHCKDLSQFPMVYENESKICDKLKDDPNGDIYGWCRDF